MASLNNVQIIGYLGRDVELKYSQNGLAFANISVATDESYTDRDGNRVDKTEWHRVVVYGKQAETSANFLRKGSQAYIQGSLQTRKWTDQNGIERYTTEIKAVRVLFLDRKENGQNTGQGYSNAASNGVNASQSQAQDIFTSGPDEVPF